MRVSVREFVERIMDERDKRYQTQFEAAGTAVNAALAAQEKSTNAAFAASEKAITKAEEAQKDYNTRSNEFRGQLDDQAKLLMPRNEVNALMKAMDDKMAVNLGATEKSMEAMKEDIKSLRETRSAATGKSAGLSAGWAIVIGAVSMLGALIAMLVKLKGVTP